MRSSYKPKPPKGRQFTDRRAFIKLSEELWGKRVQISEKSIPKLQKMLVRGLTEGKSNIVKMLKIISSVLMTNAVISTRAYRTIGEALDSIPIPSDPTEIGLPKIISKNNYTLDMKSVLYPWIIKYAEKPINYRVVDTPVSEKSDRHKPIYGTLAYLKGENEAGFDIIPIDLKAFNEFMASPDFHFYPKYRTIVPVWATITDDGIQYNYRVTSAMISRTEEATRVIQSKLHERFTPTSGYVETGESVGPPTGDYPVITTEEEGRAGFRLRPLEYTDVQKALIERFDRTSRETLRDLEKAKNRLANKDELGHIMMTQLKAEEEGEL